jgi:hypothetical protein
MNMIGAAHHVTVAICRENAGWRLFQVASLMRRHLLLAVVPHSRCKCATNSSAPLNFVDEVKPCLSTYPTPIGCVANDIAWSTRFAQRFGKLANCLRKHPEHVRLEQRGGGTLELVSKLAPNDDAKSATSSVPADWLPPFPPPGAKDDALLTRITKAVERYPTGLNALSIPKLVGGWDVRRHGRLFDVLQARSDLFVFTYAHSNTALVQLRGQTIAQAVVDPHLVDDYDMGTEAATVDPGSEPDRADVLANENRSEPIFDDPFSLWSTAAIADDDLPMTACSTTQDACEPLHEVEHNSPQSPPSGQVAVALGDADDGALSLLAELYDETAADIAATGADIANSNGTSEYGFQFGDVASRPPMPPDFFALRVLPFIPVGDSITLPELEHACHWIPQKLRLFGPLLLQLQAFPKLVHVDRHGWIQRVPLAAAELAPLPTPTISADTTLCHDAAEQQALLALVPTSMAIAISDLPPVVRGDVSLDEATTMLASLPSGTVSFTTSADGTARLVQRGKRDENEFDVPPVALLLTLVGYHLRPDGHMLTNLDVAAQWSVHHAPRYGPLPDALRALADLVVVELAPHGVALVRWAPLTVTAVGESVRAVVRAVRSNLRFSSVRRRRDEDGKAVSGAAPITCHTNRFQPSVPADPASTAAVSTAAVDSVLARFGGAVPVTVLSAMLRAKDADAVRAALTEQTEDAPESRRDGRSGGRSESLDRKKQQARVQRKYSELNRNWTRVSQHNVALLQPIHKDQHGPDVVDATVVVQRGPNGRADDTWVFIPTLKMALQVPPWRMAEASVASAKPTGDDEWTRVAGTDYKNLGAKVNPEAVEQKDVGSDTDCDRGKAPSEEPTTAKIEMLRTGLQAAETGRREAEAALDAFMRSWVLGSAQAKLRT